MSIDSFDGELSVDEETKVGEFVEGWVKKGLIPVGCDILTDEMDSIVKKLLKTRDLYPECYGTIEIVDDRDFVRGYCVDPFYFNFDEHDSSSYFFDVSMVELETES